VGILSGDATQVRVPGELLRRVPGGLVYLTEAEVHRRSPVDAASLGDIFLK
jgi:hypothetical protein